MSGLADFPGSISKLLGSMTLDLKGKILTSSGDLLENKSTAEQIYHILQDINGMVKISGKNDPFKRFTVMFQDYSFVVTIQNDTIFIVKKKVN